MTSGKVLFAKVWGLKEGTSKGDVIGYLQTAKCGGGKVRKFVWSGDSMTTAIVGIEGLSNTKFKNLLKNKHYLQNNYQIYIERSHPPSETGSSAGQQSQNSEIESTQPSATLADFFPPLSTPTHNQQVCSQHGAKPSYSDILSSKLKENKTATKQKTKKKSEVDHKDNREEQPPRTETENFHNIPTGATPNRNTSLVQSQAQNSQTECMFEIGGPGEKMKGKTFSQNKENKVPHSVPSPQSLLASGTTAREYEGSSNSNRNTHSNTGATHSHSQSFPDGEHPPAFSNQPLLESSNHDLDLEAHLVQNSAYYSSVMHEYLSDTTHGHSQLFDAQYQEFHSEYDPGYGQYGSGYNMEYGSSYNPMYQIESYPGVEPVYNAYMEASPSLKSGLENDSTSIVSEEPQSPYKLLDNHNCSTGDTGEGEQNGLWPDLDSREDSKEVDLSSTLTTATVKVENVGRKLHKTTLEHFFCLEDHGGGEILSISVIGNAAYITFKSTQVAKRVATRSEFHVEDCILKTSLSQRRPDPLDHILQLWNPDNTIVLTAIPESVCNEHLEAHIDAETGLRAEEHYKLRKRRDSLALVVLPPHYSGLLHHVFQTLLQSNRLLTKSPPTSLTVKPLTPVRTVFVSDFNKEPEVLQGYFSNRKKSGGGRVEQLRMISKNQALVTFHESAVVQTILTYDHSSALGSDVIVQMYQPVLSRLFRIPDVDIPEMDIPRQRHDSLLHHLSKPLYRHIRKHGFATLLQNQLSKMCAKLNLDEENSTFMIHPQSGSEWIPDWTLHVCQEIKAFTNQFQKIPLEIPQDMASTIYPVILESVHESEVTVSLSPSSGEVVLVGSPQNVKDVEQKVREIIHKNLDVSKEESFSPEILLLVKTCIHKELKEKHKQVIFKVDLPKGVLEVRGKSSGCEEFLKEVATLKPAVVKVNLPKEIVHFYASPKGRTILNKNINQGDVTYFFTDENGSMSHDVTRSKEVLHLLGPTNEKVLVFSSDLKEYLQLCKVPVPKEFNKMATEGDDWVWNQTRKDLEAKYTCALLPVGEAINIVCEPQCASAITKEVEDMIKDTCYKEAKVQIPKGNWLYLTKYCKEWTKLCNEIEQAKIRLSLSGETAIPTITFYGEISPVKRFFSSLLSLSNRVITEHMKTRKPGMVKYFLSKSGRDQLEGIGAKHNAVVEIASQSEEDKRSKFSKVTGNSIVCKASAAHGIKVHIVLGDLTTFPVDVIVNAANDHLQHSGGLARALSKKGGKVIQGESSSYVKRHGTLAVGDAVLMKHVGKLDCKAILHAVGPRWFGGNADEESCLRKAVRESLSACAGEKFETVAFPAIGAGIFMVPEDICALNMIKAIKEFSHCNTNCSIRTISIVLLQPAIAGQFCKFSKMLLSDVVLDSSFKRHLHDIMQRGGSNNYEKEDVEPLSEDRSSSPEEAESGDQINEDKDLPSSDDDNDMRVVSEEPEKELYSVAVARTSPQEIPIETTGEEMPKSESSHQFFYRGPSPGALKSTHLTASSYPVIVKKGSITDVVADACVNSAHRTLNLTRGSISLAFLRAGGHELQRKCDEYVQLNGPLQSGDIAVTDSPSLSSLGCRYIIHTVGRAYDGTGGSAEQVLRRSIFKVLNECDHRNLSVVAFPALGTGNLAFPPSESATIMLDVFRAYFSGTTSRSLKSVLVVIQDTPVYSAFQRVFASSPLSQDNPWTPDTSLMPVKVETEAPLHTGFGQKLVSRQLSQNTSYPLQIPMEANIKSENSLYFVSNRVKIVLVRGDITRDDSEGIICSNSPSLMRPQGLMGALLTKGGQQLQRECLAKCQTEGPLQSGKVILTSSGSPGGLRCEHILHIPVPHNHSELQTGVKNALNVADKERLSSVSMPAIGSGSNQIPLQHVAQSLCNAIVAFTYSNPSHLNLIKVFLLEDRLWTTFSNRFSLMFGNALEISGGTNSKVPTNQPMSHPLHETSAEHPQLACSPSANMFMSADVPPHKDPGLCITIHTGSQETMRKVVTEVNAAIEDNYTEEKVRNINKLPAPMEAELKQLAERHTVELVCMHSGEILLKGSKRDVDPLKSEIQDKLHAIERAESRQKEAELMTAKFQWKWKDEHGTLHNYDPMVNLNIEEAHHQKRENCRVKVCSDRGTREGAIDLKRMIETNQATAKCFSVVRHIVEKERVEDDRPTTWTPMPLDEQGKEVECHVVELSLDSEEYRSVQDEFLRTIRSPSTMRSRFSFGHQSVASSWEIVGIKRIQNPKLYSQYMARKRVMEKSIDRGLEYERRLYHGCAEGVVDSINHSGFNRSFAGKHATAYGKGVYFATEACISASDTYSTPDMFGRKRMYLARVLVGEYAIGDSSMVTPPSKKQSVQYDSVVNTVINPSIFVIFYDAQVYPEYLIQFRKVPTVSSYLY